MKHSKYNTFLRVQVMSEQRMEVLKLQLQEEVEDPFRAKLHTAEAEVSTVRLHSH